MPMFALVLRPWVLRMRGHGVIPRTLADDVRIHGQQSGLQQDGDQCTLHGRLKEAVEDTFLFMDNMGAAISVGKSSTYASRASLRSALRGQNWGAKLDAGRGGMFRQSFTAGIYNPDELVSIASDA